MANPQKENGYTSIANEILMETSKIKLNGTQHGILLVLWRYTYGFGRKECSLSDSFIANAICAHRVLVNREINKLISRKIILITKKATFSTPKTIRFNKNYEDWLEDDLQGGNKYTGNQIVASTGNQIVTQGVNESVTQENNILKQNIKQASVSLHEELKKNFEIIYSVYPKKVGKQSAFENYKKWISGRKINAKKVKFTNRQIYIAVCGYVKSKEEAGTDLKYYKDFSTLMGKQLLDYMPEEEEKEDAD